MLSKIMKPKVGSTWHERNAGSTEKKRRGLSQCQDKWFYLTLQREPLSCRHSVSVCFVRVVQVLKSAAETACLHGQDSAACI